MTNNNDSFLELTEFWQDGQYDLVCKKIHAYKWGSKDLMCFCGYFIKYLGEQEFQILCKLI